MSAKELALARMRMRLSRDGNKETTLDYHERSFYRAALRFADARGLQLIHVGRTLLHDRLYWLLRQKQTLADIVSRLAAAATSLGLGSRVASISRVRGALVTRNQTNHAIRKDRKPMLAGITVFTKSIEKSVEDKISADPVLKVQWQEVSARFHHIYADPQAAFNAVNVDAMVGSTVSAKATIAAISKQPETFGPLKCKRGLFVSKAEIRERETALINAPALARDLDEYLQKRAEAGRRYEAEERAVRLRVSIEIPALSEAARQTLERVRDAIDRNDLPAGLEYALADRHVQAELEGFAKVVAARFGERSFLPLAAKEPDGKVFEKFAAGMTPEQRVDLQSAWKTMRTVQQLSAHERAVTARKQAEALRQSKNAGLSIK